MYVLPLLDSVSQVMMLIPSIAIGGSVFTEVTSAGGQAITLASSGAGVVTSFAGSVYTVATSAASSAASAKGSGYAPTKVYYHDQG
jgi:hypothetical protein